MSLILVYAASLLATFVTWYGCTLIPNRPARGVLRATVIALLCAPGILIGHGFGIAPMLFALSVQPSIFNFLSILVVWIIGLAVHFAVPSFRRDRGEWPPSAREIFLRFYPGKLLFFGAVAAMVMLSLIYADDRRDLWIVSFKYGLFFAAALVNLTFCYWATRAKQASPLVTPLFFSLPVLLVSPPTVAIMWYGSGAVGALIGNRQQRFAAWICLAVFGTLCVNSAFRIYLAATAEPHVTIGGGIAGNAMMAGLFAFLAIAPWWLLRRRASDRTRPGGSYKKVTGA